MSNMIKWLSESADCIDLDNQSLLTVRKIRSAMSTIGILMSDADIVNSIIRSFTAKSSYVSILPLTQKVKLSLPEVEKLLGMGKAEKNAFMYLLGECKNNSNLRPKTNILKLEVEISGEVTPIGDSHAILDDLHDDLEFLFLHKYRNIAFRAGYKKLIIKSAIASAIYGNMEDFGELEKEVE